MYVGTDLLDLRGCMRTYIRIQWSIRTCINNARSCVSFELIDWALR